MMVYCSILPSYLSYCISSWKNASKTTLNPLDNSHGKAGNEERRRRRQKRAVRIITDRDIAIAQFTPNLHFINYRY